MSSQRVNFRFGPQLKNYSEGLIASFAIDQPPTTKKKQAKENQKAAIQEISLDRKGTFWSVVSDLQLLVMDMVPCSGELYAGKMNSSIKERKNLVMVA